MKIYTFVVFAVSLTISSMGAAQVLGVPSAGAQAQRLDLDQPGFTTPDYQVPNPGGQQAPGSSQVPSSSQIPKGSQAPQAPQGYYGTGLTQSQRQAPAQAQTAPQGRQGIDDEDPDGQPDLTDKMFVLESLKMNQLTAPDQISLGNSVTFNGYCHRGVFSSSDVGLNYYNNISSANFYVVIADPALCGRIAPNFNYISLKGANGAPLTSSLNNVQITLGKFSSPNSNDVVHSATFNANCVYVATEDGLSPGKGRLSCNFADASGNTPANITFLEY